MGWSVRWGSGLPYSVVSTRPSADSFGSMSWRTSYPTGQRNDQRNEGSWDIDLSYRKDFHFRHVTAAVSVEVENVLNNDDLRIVTVDRSQFLGITGSRNFGRRWQLGLQIHF